MKVSFSEKEDSYDYISNLQKEIKKINSLEISDELKIELRDKLASKCIVDLENHKYNIEAIKKASFLDIIKKMKSIITFREDLASKVDFIQAYNDNYMCFSFISIYSEIICKYMDKSNLKEIVGIYFKRYSWINQKVNEYNLSHDGIINIEAYEYITLGFLEGRGLYASILSNAELLKELFNISDDKLEEVMNEK
tara:strand:- start:7352 stop:7936 length:585 start_codon:yes stop_codon:yes gene_type:complete